MAITYLGNAGVSAYKKSYHQFSLNNLMKIEILEFKLYFDVVVFFFFFFCFLAIFAQSFPDARLSPLIISGPVVLTKSIIFSGNSILFLDFSYLLSIFFFLMMLLLALLLLLFFRQPYKNNNLDSSARVFQ